MTNRNWLLPTLVFTSLLLGEGARADVPAVIPVQGYLEDAAGLPVSDDVSITFTLYDAGGTLQHTETQLVPVLNGFFVAFLGDAVALSPALFAAQSELYLGIRVGSDPEMTPRLQLGSMPYAMESANAKTLAGQPASAFAVNDHRHAWSDVTGVPPDLADGDQDTTYTEGNGVDITSSGVISLDTTVVESVARAACFDTASELHATLDTRYAPAQVPWTSLSNVPPGFADGVDNGVTGNGTAGRIARFTGTNAVGDSIMSETPGVIDVNGDIRVTGKYRYTNPRMSSYAMPTTIFQPRDANDDDRIENFRGAVTVSSGATPYDAAINGALMLPHGARVHEITCFVYDDTSTGDATFNFSFQVRQLASRYAATQIGSGNQATSGASTTPISTVVYSSVTGFLVDNGTEALIMEVAWTQTSLGFAIAFTGCTVDFSMTGPDP